MHDRVREMREKAARWATLAREATDKDHRDKCRQVQESYLSLAAMFERNARSMRPND